MLPSVSTTTCKALCLLLLLARASSTGASVAAATAHAPAVSNVGADAEAQVAGDLIERRHASVFDAGVTQLADAAQEDYDLYVLAQSWQPEFCHGKEKVYPGCRQPQAFWRDHLTLHGLWPERERGAPPGFCQGEPFDAAQVEKEVGLDVLKQFWPDVKFADDSPDYPDFWKHEWTRHGTCSRLAQTEYFANAVRLVRNATASTPALVRESVGKDVALPALRAAFEAPDPSGDGAAVAVLKCVHGGDTLAQVFTCWSKDAEHRPVARRACPAHVLQEDTCSRAKIHILAFP